MFNLLGLDLSRAVEILNGKNIKYTVLDISSDRYNAECDSRIVVKVSADEDNKFKLWVSGFKTKL